MRGGTKEALLPSCGFTVTLAQGKAHLCKYISSHA